MKDLTDGGGLVYRCGQNKTKVGLKEKRKQRVRALPMERQNKTKVGLKVRWLRSGAPGGMSQNKTKVGLKVGPGRAGAGWRAAVRIRLR